jgi:hypothetical protein
MVRRGPTEFRNLLYATVRSDGQKDESRICPVSSTCGPIIATVASDQQPQAPGRKQIVAASYDDVWFEMAPNGYCITRSYKADGPQIRSLCYRLGESLRAVHILDY